MSSCSPQLRARIGLSGASAAHNAQAHGLQCERPLHWCPAQAHQKGTRLQGKHARVSIDAKHNGCVCVQVCLVYYAINEVRRIHVVKDLREWRRRRRAQLTHTNCSSVSLDVSSLLFFYGGMCRRSGRVSGDLMHSAAGAAGGQTHDAIYGPVRPIEIVSQTQCNPSRCSRRLAHICTSLSQYSKTWC